MGSKISDSTASAQPARKQAAPMGSKISDSIASAQLFKAQGSFLYNMHAYTQH